MEFKPVYYKELNIISPTGSVGIVTLWNHPGEYCEQLKGQHPELFNPGSELVTITSLYGNGLPQMLANLIYNPQISKIVIIGEDKKTAPSYKYLLNFLAAKVQEERLGDITINRIEDTDFYLDSRLKPEMFNYLELKRFATTDLKGVAEYIKGARPRPVSDKDRIKINLAEPHFDDFPSDLSGHNIRAKTPLEAWHKVLLCIERYGHAFNLKKGRRHGLYNLDVHIQNPSFEDEILLKKWGFNIDTIKEYQQDILKQDIPPGIKYTYGNRMCKHFGGDALRKVGELLKEDKLNRHAFISLWDTKQDLLERESSPCFTDAYFVYDVGDNSLMMTAHFRTHNAASAWLLNLYGLRAIQKKVAEYAGLKPGKINIRSRWIGIDLKTPNIIGILQRIKGEDYVDINDPKGYYIINIDKEKNLIHVQHFSPNDVLIGNIYGHTEQEVRDQMRRLDGFSSTDHAMWFGVELQRMAQQLK